MRATISKDFAFAAAHRLTLVPPEHQCARLHGHNYVVRIECSGPISARNAWVVDYAEISAAAKSLIETLDHQHLNDVLQCETTAEMLALWFFERLRPRLPLLSRVGVSETPKTWAWVSA